MRGKRKSHIGWILLLLLLAVLAGACVYFYPVWKAAGMLRENMDLTRFTYELEVELNGSRLEAGQKRVLENLGKLTGFGEESLFSLTFRGSVWEDKIHALIYPQGAREPLLELYLGNDMDVINETLPYNTIRGNLIEKYGLLDYIMPAEMESVYMTLEQVEEIFELDLSRLRDFRLPVSGEKHSRAAYFALLALMSREESEEGSRFEKSMDQARLTVNLAGGAKGLPTDTARGKDRVVLELEMRNPDEVLTQKAGLLNRLGIQLPLEQLRQLKSIRAVISPGTGEELVFPTRMIDQKKVDLITGIRDFIRKIGDFFS